MASYTQAAASTVHLAAAVWLLYSYTGTASCHLHPFASSRPLFETSAQVTHLHFQGWPPPRVQQVTSEACCGSKVFGHGFASGTVVESSKRATAACTAQRLEVTASSRDLLEVLERAYLQQAGSMGMWQSQKGNSQTYSFPALPLQRQYTAGYCVQQAAYFSIYLSRQRTARATLFCKKHGQHAVCALSTF